jgi:hypothetical protein
LNAPALATATNGTILRKKFRLEGDRDFAFSTAFPRPIALEHDTNVAVKYDSLKGKSD